MLPRPVHFAPGMGAAVVEMGLFTINVSFAMVSVRFWLHRLPRNALFATEMEEARAGTAIFTMFARSVKAPVGRTSLRWIKQKWIGELILADEIINKKISHRMGDFYFPLA
jgi:hypothetical protein